MNQCSDYNTLLRQEAVYLHHYLFGFEPPAEVVARYAEACSSCLGNADLAESEAVRKVVEQKLDPEAIEFWLRIKGRTLLSKKIQVLFYFCEVRSTYLGFFFNTNEPRYLALLRLMAALAKFGFKAIKGIWHVKRYRLG